MVDAYNKGIAEQQRQFDTTRADFQPYRNVGYTSLAQLGDLVGTNGADKQASAIDALKASPFYQRLFRQGQDAVLAAASATGGMRGGDTQRGLYDAGVDTLMNVYGQQLSSLGGLAGMGMGATESVANFGQQKANNVTNLLGQIGGARASGYLTRGGINSQMWNNLGGMLEQGVSAFLPGGGGFASLFKGGF